MDECDSNSDKPSRSNKISKQKAWLGTGARRSTAFTDPRVPGAQLRTCWDRGSLPHESSGRGNS